MRRKTWVLSATALLIAATATCGVVLISSADSATPSEPDTPVNTAKVEKGTLSATVSQAGILTYRARPDGSPYTVVNQAGGIYTGLPENGDRVDCGGEFYRVDDKPVVLLCGTVPTFRVLHRGDVGRDARQLNQNLHQLGYDTRAHVRVGPDGSAFTVETAKALAVLQRDRRLPVTGVLAPGDAVFLPEPVRIAEVTSTLGAAASPGAPVAKATSDRLQVQLALDPSQQGAVNKGDRAQVVLPGNTTAAGRVEGFGRVAQAPAGPDNKAAGATIPTYISLDDVTKASGLDQAPVQVDITTAGVEDAVSVPATALVGKSGGGFAVEVVRAGGRRELVAVQLGLFDTGGGRVQVEGDVRAGDDVVVPSV